MAHLKGTVIEFLRVFFDADDLAVRFQPSYFPFTGRRRRWMGVRPLPGRRVPSLFSHGVA